EGRYGVYNALVQLLAGEGQLEEALSLLQRAQSKLLFDAIRLDALTVRDPNLRALLRQATDLEQAIAARQRFRLAELLRPESERDPDRIDNLARQLASTAAQL